MTGVGLKWRRAFSLPTRLGKVIINKLRCAEGLRTPLYGLQLGRGEKKFGRGEASAYARFTPDELIAYAERIRFTPDESCKPAIVVVVVDKVFHSRLRRIGPAFSQSFPALLGS